MKIKRNLLSFFCVCLILPLYSQSNYLFTDTKLPISKRVEDLVSRLTLEEKVAQMLNNAPAVQRLGIPAYNWWNECLHGIARTDYKVTVFPQAIGMAASWNPILLKDVATAISDEGRAIYHDSSSKGNRAIYHGLTYWTPNINIFRDPRWGRGQETYGEDPFLTGRMGKAFVAGIQGDDPKYLKAAACAKHYAVHSGPENTRHSFNTFVTTYDLWDTYLPAFRDLVVDAKVAGVMCAYNAYSGQPCCGNNLLMQEILRDKWNFTGYVTSDCGAIDDFYNYHKTHSDAKSAAADAIFHGTDLDCGTEAYKALIEAVNSGLVKESQIDESLRRLFTIRFRLGMFDPQQDVKYSSIPLSVLESQKHKDLSLQIARESIVLLKNENNTLPLSKKLKKVAVIGPNANNEVSVLGNYNGFPSVVTTPYKSIKEKLQKADVVYEKGVDFVASIEDNKQNISDLIERLKDRDVVIFVGGISPELEGEELQIKLEGFRGGDRTSISLPKVQTALMQALKAANIPTVFVMMTGSAIATPWESENIPAILNAWYGGQDAGTAIADILFGDYNPSGKLPVTFYEKDSDLPVFNSYEMKTRTYRYFDGEVLYPFGYGLSYTDFEYSDLQLPSTMNTNDNVEISVKVKNIGKMAGEEVVQLYLSYPAEKNNKPLYALKSFERISLKPDESKTIRLKLSPRELGLVDMDGILKVTEGRREIYVGGSSPSKTKAKHLPIIKKGFDIVGETHIVD